MSDFLVLFMIMNKAGNKPVQENALAFVKLEGEGLDEGLVGAKTGSEILNGIDRLVKRGLAQKYPGLYDVDFDVPVLVQKGSWTALIPTDVVDWVIAAVGASVTAYGVKAGQNMADNDFSDKGIKDAVKKSVGSLQSTIKIAKHLKGPRKKVKQGVRFEDNNQTLLIPDDNGNYIKVKREEYEEYLKYPEELLSSIAGSPKNKQSLSVGLVENSKVSVEKVESEDTKYFVSDEPLDNESKILFPEMKHGDRVELIGELTRGNNQTNNMGFKYQGHVLVCRPSRGKIEQYKPQLYLKCILRGRVQRLMDDSVKDTLMKPHLIIEDMEIIEDDHSQMSLIQE